MDIRHGLTIKETAKELGISVRTVFRMIKDGRLKANKFNMPYMGGEFIWLINPISIARIQIRKDSKFDTEEEE